jgi:PAS domain S-box-containing protein
VTEIFTWLESIFSGIPLGFLGAWGRFGYFAGLILAIGAYGGVTLKPGGKWGLGWQRQRWDTKAMVSIPVTYVLIFASGWIGSSWVLVPGAQTFESLKDLAVLVCILIFGYPALLTVPFAYASSDLIEGVPPDFLLDWWTGYFINPACFWIAYQLFGKNPDFRRARTWAIYLAFVLLFLALEPALWGYICSGEFTPEIAYRSVTPALVFTTSITWLMGPFAMLGALPLARRFGLFWADIPGHVRERRFGRPDIVWESGSGAPPDDVAYAPRGVSIRLVILAPMLALVVVLVGATAYVTLDESEDAATKLASRLHQEISENINLQLDDYLAQRGTPDALLTDDINALLAKLPIARHGRAFIVDHFGRTIATSGEPNDTIVALSTDGLMSHLRDRNGKLEGSVQFRVIHITARPLARETWLAHAAAYEDRSGGHADWILVTAIPEAFYLSGVRAGQSRSAMIFALALLVSMVLAALLALIVMAPLRRIASTIGTPSGGTLPLPLPGSRLEELDTLSQAFNAMSMRLKKSFDDLHREAEARETRERALLESEARLRRSEDRMQLAVKAARLGIWDWDVDTDELTWDDSMYQLFDIPKEEAVRTPADWLRRVEPEDVERLNGEIQEAIRGDRVFSSDFRIRWRDGSIRIIRGAANTVRDANGRALRMVGVIRDMTDLSMAERELRRHRDHLEELVRERTLALEKSYADLRALETLRDSMVHMVVHDLRSPMTALMFSLEMLIENLESVIGAEDRMRLENALTSVESLARMANDMLDVSRLEEDKFPLAPTSHDLSDLAQIAMHNLRGMARARDVRLQLEPSVCQCDGDLIRRVVENLVSNGIKHTPPDKPLWLSVAFPAGEPRVEVRDQGSGIPAEARTKIFEKFGTLAGDGQRQYHSAGLGLTFCKMAVEAHGGHIGVDSEVGKGSTFWFTLPGTVIPSAARDPGQP